MTLGTILVAVDFGDASARAVSIAGSLAARCGTSLKLLHAEPAEVPAYFTPEQISTLDGERRLRRTQAERFLTEFGHVHTSEPFAVAVEEGPADEVILAASRASELVVMGTHGRQGPRRWWLGSVAERVLREIARPLLVVRSDAPPTVDLAFRSAVVAAPAPLTGNEALVYARRIGACFNLEAVDARFGRSGQVHLPDDASIVVAAMPNPATPRWLADHGEPLVRRCRVPIFFVPESEGVSDDR